MRSIRELFGIPAPTEENSGLIEWVFPAGDPVEQILLASGGARSGLLALADQVLAAFDTLVEVAQGTEKVAVEKRSVLREAALSNPLLADQLRTFDMMQPIWQLARWPRFASLFARHPPEHSTVNPPAVDQN